MAKKKSNITMIAEMEIESDSKKEIKQYFKDIFDSEKGLKLNKFRVIYK